MSVDTVDIEEVRDAFKRGESGRERFWVRIEEREVSEVDGAPRLTGLASVFNQRAKVRLRDGRIAEEEVKSSAFNNTLGRGDIFLLWQHDWKMPLARTGAGNLQLRVVSDGLEYDATLPDTSLARDSAELVRSGVVNQMSFGFTTPPGGDKVTIEQRGTLLRSLHDIHLHEISLISQGAYGPKASASVRSDAFSMLCRSLGVGEDEVLTQMNASDVFDLATLRASTASQQVEPGAETTSEGAGRAVSTVQAGIPTRLRLAVEQFSEAAARAGLPRIDINGAVPSPTAG